MSASPSIQPAAPVVRKRLVLIGFPDGWHWEMFDGEGNSLGQGRPFDAREECLLSAKEVFDIGFDDMMTLKTMSMLSWAVV